MLEIKTSYYSNILNIELYGALDSLTSPDFKHWLIEKSKAGYHYFALNCAGLEYISSRGIGILTELNNVLNGNQHRLILYHVSNEVLNLLQFLKLSEIIPIVDSFERTRDTFSKNPPLERKESEPESQPDFSVTENIQGVPTETDEIPMDQNVPATGEQGGQIDHGDIEENIDLNLDNRVSHGDDISVINIVFCPNCGESLKVSKKGLYLCPECRTKFNYPF